MGIHVIPDWDKAGTAEELEQQIGNGFRMLGPGLYLQDRECALVLALDQTPARQLAERQPPDQRFRFFYYGTDYHNTVLAYAADLPVRADKRPKMREQVERTYIGTPTEVRYGGGRIYSNARAVVGAAAAKAVATNIPGAINIQVGEVRYERRGDGWWAAPGYTSEVNQTLAELLDWTAHLQALIDTHIRFCHADPDSTVPPDQYATLLEAIGLEFDRLRDAAAGAACPVCGERAPHEHLTPVEGAPGLMEGDVAAAAREHAGQPAHKVPTDNELAAALRWHGIDPARPGMPTAAPVVYSDGKGNTFPDPSGCCGPTPFEAAYNATTLPMTDWIGVLPFGARLERLPRLEDGTGVTYAAGCLPELVVLPVPLPAVHKDFRFTKADINAAANVAGLAAGKGERGLLCVVCGEPTLGLLNVCPKHTGTNTAAGNGEPGKGGTLPFYYRAPIASTAAEAVAACFVYTTEDGQRTYNGFQRWTPARQALGLWVVLVVQLCQPDSSVADVWVVEDEEGFRNLKAYYREEYGGSDPCFYLLEHCFTHYHGRTQAERRTRTPPVPRSGNA